MLVKLFGYVTGHIDCQLLSQLKDAWAIVRRALDRRLEPHDSGLVNAGWSVAPDVEIVANFAEGSPSRCLDRTVS